MPRPGPRPYECVRRAWHSDRHQPIRGSIIQQIFKVLHESHSPATKKNKEWQEKLPIVVLKAEEIMYSKANSEAEYVDSQTLWERVNDAVNTIIRRDESTETGDLLPPCVEAALNLGCVPVRASRSQRHTNPRSYLSPTPDEPVCSSSKITENTSNTQNHHVSPRLQNQPNQTMKLPHLVSEGKDHVLAYRNHPNNISSNTGSVYPLYYGSQFPKRPERSHFPFQIPRTHNPIIVGRPVFPSMTEPSRMGCLETTVSETNFGKNHGKAHEPEFDLSLRLGSFKDPCLELEKEPVNAIGKEFSFFPTEATNVPSGSNGKKRKAQFDINL